MARRIRGLVEVDDTGINVRLEVSLERRGSGGNGSEMTSPNQHCIE